MANHRWRPNPLPNARWAGALIAALVVLQPPAPADAQTWMSAERLHGLALEKFRHGRFPEAYGRFVDLANAGHAPSARVALWMCQNGPNLFGSEWDCTPDEAAEWAALSRGVNGSASAPLPHRPSPASVKTRP